MNINKLREAVDDQLDPKPGDVIRFKDGSVHLVALFTEEKLWDVCGIDMPTECLLQILRGEGISDIEVPTGWEKVAK